MSMARAAARAKRDIDKDLPRKSGAASAKAIFDAVKPIAQGIVETFGPMCEVVVHDYRSRSRSVILVAGDVTHRKVGQSASQIGLRMMAQGDNAEDDYNYITRTESGRVLKSTTILLRSEGHVIGALCINFDLTEVRQLTHGLAQLAGDGLVRDPEDVTFSPDLRGVIDTVVEAEELTLGSPVERMNREERLHLLATLEVRGVFALRGSVAEVARRLGISRATAYNYLTELRAPTNGHGP